MPSKSCYITLLGGLRLKREGGAPVEFPAQQAGALLAYLALRIRRTPTREELMEQLLPGEEPEQAQPKLRRYLLELRRRLEQMPFEQADLLIATRQTIRLNPDLVTTDVAEFEDALRDATRATELLEQEQHLSRAARLYQGDLLPGFYQECFAAERLRLAHLYETALQTLARVCEQSGDLKRAVEIARQVIALDPLKEEAYCDLMRLYAAQGQPTAVLKQYQELERILKEELNQEPSPDARQLMESLRQSALQRLPRLPREETVPAVAPERGFQRAPDGLPSRIPPLRSPSRPPYWRRLPFAAAVLLLLVVALLRLPLALRHRRLPAGPKPSGPKPFVADAKPIWVARYPSTPVSDEKLNSQPTAMTTDAAGNIYITGFVSTLYHDVDFLTVKYDTNGKLLWRKRYNGPGNDVDRAHSIAVDKDGNVYVTGDSLNGKGNGLIRLSGLDWATIKYDKDGNPSPTWQDVGFGVGVRRYNGPDDGEDRPRKICVNGQGDVYVAGYSSAKRRTGGAFMSVKEWALIKYDALGNQLWVRRERPMNPLSNAEAVDMVLGGDGFIYVTGQYDTDHFYRTKSDLLTIKYAPNGDRKWRKTYSGQGYGDVTACRMVVDGSGHVYITGQQYDGDPASGGTKWDIFTLAYDSSGNELWPRPSLFDNKKLSQNI